MDRRPPTKLLVAHAISFALAFIGFVVGFVGSVVFESRLWLAIGVLLAAGAFVAGCVVSVIYVARYGKDAVTGGFSLLPTVRKALAEAWGRATTPRKN